MPNSEPLFTSIYSKFPNLIKLIFEDIIVLASFYFVLVSMNLCLPTVLGVSLLILLMKYLYKIAANFLPFNNKVTARSVSFTTFSVAFMFVYLLLNYLDFESEFIAYCLILVVILWTFVLFYKQSKPENLQVAYSLFFLMKLGKIAVKLILCLFFIFLSNQFFVDMHLIPTGSMSPTVHSNEVVLSDKLYYEANYPNRWDTAIMKHQGYHYKLLKRIVGMPGDEISLGGGNVFINDELLVRPQSVLNSQMQKAPISYIDFEKRLYNNEDKNKKVHVQFNPTLSSEENQELTSSFMAQSGAQTQAQTKPDNIDEIMDEFDQWWHYNCTKKEMTKDYYRFHSFMYQNKESVTLLFDKPTNTDVNGVKTLTDDLMLQLDARFIDCDEFYLKFQPEGISEAIQFNFLVNFSRRTIDIICLKLDKRTNLLVKQDQTTLTLKSVKYRNKMFFRITDGLPVAMINGVEYKADFEPVNIIEKLEKSQIGFLFNASIVDIFSIGLFTPAYYNAHGVLDKGKKVKIPEDSYFVLGDNSSYSLDSRDFEVFMVKYKDGTSKIMPLDADYEEDVESQYNEPYPFIKREDILSRAFAVFKPIELARLIN